MTSYRCYFLDEQQHIHGRREIDTCCEAFALAQAFILLEQQPSDLVAADVWFGARRVGTEWRPRWHTDRRMT
jgi:hypothetical protein